MNKEILNCESVEELRSIYNENSSNDLDNLLGKKLSKVRNLNLDGVYPLISKGLIVDFIDEDNNLVLGNYVSNSKWQFYKDKMMFNDALDAYEI